MKFSREYQRSNWSIWKLWRSFKAFTRRFRKVSWLPQGDFKSVLRVFHGWFKPFKQVLRGVSRIFHRGFKEVSRIFSKCFCEGVSRLFCFWKFIVACHSSQLPEHKKGLFCNIYLNLDTICIIAQVLITNTLEEKYDDICPPNQHLTCLSSLLHQHYHHLRTTHYHPLLPLTHHHHSSPPNPHHLLSPTHLHFTQPYPHCHLKHTHLHYLRPHYHYHPLTPASYHHHLTILVTSCANIIITSHHIIIDHLSSHKTFPS